jgi:hypothetical protein
MLQYVDPKVETLPSMLLQVSKLTNSSTNIPNLQSVYPIQP